MKFLNPGERRKFNLNDRRLCVDWRLQENQESLEILENQPASQTAWEIQEINEIQ